MIEKNNKKIKFAIFLLYFIVYILMVIVGNHSYKLLFTAYLVITGILIALFYTSLLGLLGNYYYASGKKTKADKYLKKAIDRNTKQPTVYLNYAISLIKDGMTENALDYLNRAYKIGAKTLTDKNILLAMGSCHLILGRPDEAIKILEELIDKYEAAECHVLEILGYAYIVKKDLDQALVYTKKALEANPQSSAAWDNLGQIHLQLSDYEKAVENFRKSLQFNENFADSNYFLGIAYENLNEPEKASVYFRKASQCPLSPLNTVKKEQIEEMVKKYTI